jgi:hypothetical protein
MIKRQIGRQIFRIEHRERGSVVASIGLTLCAGNIDHRRRMPARVARWVGVHAKQRHKTNGERRFLEGLAHGCMLDRLANIDKSPGDCPSTGRIAALDQHNG